VVVGRYRVVFVKKDHMNFFSVPTKFIVSWSVR
jgi:hypothetical protein